MSVQSTDNTAVFPMLADPANYQACEWDLLDLPERRAYWLDLFRSHFGGLLEAYRAEAEDRGEDVEIVERSIAAVNRLVRAGLLTEHRATTVRAREEDQDGVFHAGFSDHALRFDLASRALVGSGPAMRRA